MKELVNVNKELFMPLELKTNVNGAFMQFEGYVRGIPSTGLCSAYAKTSDPTPDGFDIGILSYVLLTGLPVQGKLAENDIVNPFRYSAGFKTSRTLDLGNNGYLETLYYWTRVDENDPGKLMFNMKGTVDLPELVSVEPTAEVWHPLGDAGQIYSEFIMSWKTAEGKILRGRAVSEYDLETEIELSKPLYRTIKFDLEKGVGEILQKEELVLYKLETMSSQVKQQISV